MQTGDFATSKIVYFGTCYKQGTCVLLKSFCRASIEIGEIIAVIHRHGSKPTLFVNVFDAELQAGNYYITVNKKETTTVPINELLSYKPLSRFGSKEHFVWIPRGNIVFSYP